MIFPVLQFRTSVAYARISTLPFLPVSSPKSLRELWSAVEDRHGKPEGRYHAPISLYRVFKRCLEMPCFAKKKHRFLSRENLLVLRYASNIICIVTILDSVQTNGTEEEVKHIFYFRQESCFKIYHVVDQSRIDDFAVKHVSFHSTPFKILSSISRYSIEDIEILVALIKSSVVTKFDRFIRQL